MKSRFRLALMWMAMRLGLAIWGKATPCMAQVRALGRGSAHAAGDEVAVVSSCGFRERGEARPEAY